MPTLSELPPEILYMIVQELRSPYIRNTGPSIYSLLYVSQQFRNLALDVYYGYASSTWDTEVYTRKLKRIRQLDATALANQRFRKLAYENYNSDEDFMQAYIQIFRAEPYNRDQALATMAAEKIMKSTTRLREYHKRRRLDYSPDDTICGG